MVNSLYLSTYEPSLKYLSVQLQLKINGEMKNALKIFVGKSEGKRTLGRSVIDEKIILE
jgi:hypothetical protein